uniref:Uncharacterized protein n=1 Tax=Oryza barthii TaxID=65489 RepID=A0A0D3FNF5_9ORYZ
VTTDAAAARTSPACKGQCRGAGDGARVAGCAGWLRVVALHGSGGLQRARRLRDVAYASSGGPCRAFGRFDDDGARGRRFPSWRRCHGVLSYPRNLQVKTSFRIRTSGGGTTRRVLLGSVASEKFQRIDDC